ncbi:hypothetical protein AVEN_51903-1 [Araneus ventricosus]|uniref:CRAL-TRIO domain-containing protein n=1 Tax=Araneus ventricosus TaxID=182803 RepID=A0A4Y2L4E0_ARAVE|nr:hypothetical protein AVEN_51903-1 [Araneus ventricosus]
MYCYSPVSEQRSTPIISDCRGSSILLQTWKVASQQCESYGWEESFTGKIGNFDQKTTFILDFTEFELKKFYDKSVINAGIQLITMYQDNYPETLKAAYLVNGKW